MTELSVANLTSDVKWEERKLGKPSNSFLPSPIIKAQYI